MGMQKYFIGYALREGAKQWVTDLKLQIAQAHKLAWSLQYPPHITLFHPFETDRHEELGKTVSEVASQLHPFSIKVLQYGHFEKETWFIDVEQSDELFELKRGIVRSMESSLGIKDNDKGFATHFHITLAHKELNLEIFSDIGELLERTPLPFEQLTIDRISIFRKEESAYIEEKSFHLHKE